MADEDPIRKPRDTSLASEGIPSDEHPLHEKNFEGPGKGTLTEPGRRDRPAVAVRQDAGLGDTSTRDETRH